MKKLIIIFIVALGIFFLTAVTSNALRCECGLVSIGDRTSVVLVRCGTPIYKEVIRIGIGIEKQPKLETWMYGPIGGMYYNLVFKDGKLFKIESFRK